MTPETKDPRYQDIGNLPSNYFGYSYKSLNIRPLTVNELRLISKAAALGDVQPMVEAVNKCIDQDAYNLTIGDFYYVLMWLKINSTPKTPYVVEWKCSETIYTNKETGAAHPNNLPIPEDLDNYTSSQCECHNSEIVHLTNLEIIQLPEENWPGLPEGFDFPRARILQEQRLAQKDPELCFIVGAAQWIAQGKTLAEKIAFLEDQSDLSMFDTASSLNELLNHGIKETTTLNCRVCRAQYPYAIQLEPYNFFR